MPSRIRLQDCNSEAFWESDGTLRIGRRGGLEVQLTHTSVTRTHAEVRRTGAGWTLRDLGSRNGTFLNGEPVGEQPRILRYGDEIRLAAVRLRVQGMGPDSAEAWDACPHPLQILQSLPHVPWLAPGYGRKLRLWAAGCIRRRGGDELHSDGDDFLSRTLMGVEALVDLEPEAFERGRLKLLDDVRHWVWETSRVEPPFWENVCLLLAPSDRQLLFSLCEAALDSRFRPPLSPPEETDARAIALAIALLRCVLGNPWRQPAVDPAWLAWSGGAVPALARAIESEKSFSDVPVLADALQDAGCTDEYLLGHLRAGQHCRGCHALDAVLGRHPLITPPVGA